MNNLQTDNSFLADKVALRMSMIPRKKNLYVVDAYHGRGTIWKNIQAMYDGKINILKIDKEDKDDLLVLVGDNRKYLSGLNLEKYDIIDLDAYGIPFEQMEIIFKSNFGGICFVTFIQSVMGMLPYGLLFSLGYTEDMIKKIPTLFNKNGYQKLCDYLWLRGVRNVVTRRYQRKVYLGFRIAS